MPVFMMAMMSRDVSAASARDNTCNLWQTCASNAGMMPGDRFSNTPCDDASLVTQPIFVDGGYAPSKIKNSVGTDAIAEACPFIDASQPLCCNQDNA